MAIWNFLTGLVKPVTELIDEVHTSEDERLQIKAKLLEMQNAMAAQVMDYEAGLLEASSRVRRHRLIPLTELYVRISYTAHIHFHSA